MSTGTSRLVKAQAKLTELQKAQVPLEKALTAAEKIAVRGRLKVEAQQVKVDSYKPAKLVEEAVEE